MANRRIRRSIKKIIFLVCCLLAVSSFAFFAYRELQTSDLQAYYFTREARKLKYWLAPGENAATRTPKTGPYDERLGYVRLPSFKERLLARGYDVRLQTRQSPQFMDLMDYRIFAPYQEKMQAGLSISDRRGEVLFASSFPEDLYDSFESIPELIIAGLLHIENRELLDEHFPHRNPAIEWSRLGNAVFSMGLRLIGSDRAVPGGSTLATQLEKYRHSPQGQTGSIGEKLRQMVSASVRTYLGGEDTIGRRRQIVLDYVNSIPLGAMPGYGEIIGLGDGLSVWYGVDFASFNAAMKTRPTSADDPHLKDWALHFKQFLSLFVAQRRPTYYLLENQSALQSRTESFLRLLANDGILTNWEKEAALAAPLVVKRRIPDRPQNSFVERKTASVFRPRLLSMLDISRLYELDRLDLEIQTTLDYEVQQKITKTLQDLNGLEFAKKAGLFAPFLLKDNDDPGKIVYSFTLYERGQDANLLRIQTDNIDQPLNINEGMKLELGSSAKLRTLVSYLEIIATLHGKYGAMPARDLKALTFAPKDHLSAWAADYLATATDRSLSVMLSAAMERTYSANPEESFFTGGGLHSFVNFDKKHDHSILPVREALYHSVNLVFIRIMRDIVSYYTYKRTGISNLLQDISDPRRQEYLERFADQEGSVFLYRFYRKYKGKSTVDALEVLLHSVNATPSRLAVIFRSVNPEASLDEFGSFIRSRFPNSTLTSKAINELYDDYAIDRFSLQDRGYIARIHPLELWAVAFLRTNPQANWEDLLNAGAEERQAVYSWLLKTHRKNSQDVRIRAMIETEAFSDIHSAWERLGYPFDSLVPSLATAIGSSADRPGALAELIGIILNNGIRYPLMRVEEFHFAEGTPFEMLFERKQGAGQQVLAPEVAAVAREALRGVVEKGTAQRVSKAFVQSTGEIVPLGGKTGTGDNRRDIYGPGGRLLQSKVINRTAVFVFYLGDRFFGTMTAFVEGQAAANYSFTSALPTQALKSLAPSIMMLAERREREAGDGTDQH